METIDNLRERVEQNSGHEGTVTAGVEKATSALPSMTWLIAAGVSMAASLGLKIAGKDTAATFVGQWVPTLLIIGLYNKIVKVAGSDRREAQSAFH